MGGERGGRVRNRYTYKTISWKMTKIIFWKAIPHSSHDYAHFSSSVTSSFCCWVSVYSRHPWKIDMLFPSRAEVSFCLSDWLLFVCFTIQHNKDNILLWNKDRACVFARHYKRCRSLQFELCCRPTQSIQCLSGLFTIAEQTWVPGRTNTNKSTGYLIGLHSSVWHRSFQSSASIQETSAD